MQRGLKESQVQAMSQSPNQSPKDQQKDLHVQAFDDKVKERLAWGEKEKKYQATIHILEEKLRNVEFNNDLQLQEAKGERRKLAQENEALRAQIQRMKIAAENPVRSRQDEKLINGLRRKVGDYEANLEKTEKELAKAQAKLVKNAEGRASVVRQLKEKYDRGMGGLKKRINVLENEMTKQARDLKTEREHCYALMSQLEKDLQQLQEQNHTTEQIMDDLFRLQEDLAHRPAARPTRIAVEALMYS
ncbi:PREDICTED: kinectin-like [Nicotiana attenuata]|uniref:kinectin-like n=1 Tax=Nicotiana attenuata TaxID=49451 RepID=UPI000904C4CE|nr:PREDICTED: kinectin-like [Nicotiana attenuata]